MDLKDYSRVYSFVHFPQAKYYMLGKKGSRGGDGVSKVLIPQRPSGNDEPLDKKEKGLQRPSVI